MRNHHAARATAVLGVVGALGLLCATPARAQSSDQGAGTSGQGPLVLSPIATTFVVAPDIKVTRLDDTAAVLAGAFAGKMIEDTVLLGGAAYWLAGPRDDVRLWYAGFLAGASLLRFDDFRIEARGLLGIGRGTLFRTVFVPRPGPTFRGVDDATFDDGRGPARLSYPSDLIIFEPEVRFALALTDAVALDAGVGYRLTGGRSAFDDEFRGVTGAVGVQITLR